MSGSEVYVAEIRRMIVSRYEFLFFSFLPAINRLKWRSNPVEVALSD
jgi:hypothetical protein